MDTLATTAIVTPDEARALVLGVLDRLERVWLEKALRGDVVAAQVLLEVEKQRAAVGEDKGGAAGGGRAWAGGAWRAAAQGRAERRADRVDRAEPGPSGGGGGMGRSEDGAAAERNDGVRGEEGDWAAGGRVDTSVVGFDPDHLWGPYFDGVVVDECSSQQERVWHALRPTLSDYGGWGLLLGTEPEDVASHWFVRLHRYELSEAGKARGWET